MMNKFLNLLFWRWIWRMRAGTARGLQVGEFFPDFALKDVHGRSQALSRPAGDQQTVLWFTNLCEDCRSKIPLLNELQREAGDRFRILAVSILEADNPLPHEISRSCAFPILQDPEDAVGNRLGLPHPPGTCPLHNLFILDGKGRILFRHHLSALRPEVFRGIWRDKAGKSIIKPGNPKEKK